MTHEFFPPDLAAWLPCGVKRAPMMYDRAVFGLSDRPGSSGRRRATRLILGVDGYRDTIKSGEISYVDAKPTGTFPGKLIRAP